MYMPGNCGQWPSPWVKWKDFRDMRGKIWVMAAGCNSPRGLGSLVPAEFKFPPPTEYCIFMCLLGKIVNLCGLMAKFINLCGIVALWHCIILTNKIIFWNLFSYLRSVAVLLCARCKCGLISTIRPLAKTIVTTRCSLGDFLRKTESFGSAWAKDCEESSEGRIE